MSNTLNKIVAHKLTEVAELKSHRPLADVRAAVADAPAVRGFLESLKSHHPMGLIAEVKRASPSAGLIREDFNPVEIATSYTDNGAACISVLTDEHFFQGQLKFLTDIRQQVDIPVLRKDFIIDPYQIYEARAAGADAVLLIGECLSDDQLKSLFELVQELGMQALIEVYEPANVERVLQLNPGFMGVNNRDLKTFVTDLNHTISLRETIPTDVLLVGESGIHTRADVERLQSAGVEAILVGESLMRSDDIGAAVRQLLGSETTKTMN